MNARASGARDRTTEALFRSHNARLLRTVRGAVRGVPYASVEDACAFAWMQFVRYAPECPTDAHAFGWLRTTATREAIKANQRPERPTDDIEIGAHAPDAEDVRAALRVLAEVPERRRDVLVLRLAGHSYREIEELRGLSYTRVNALLTEARAHVRRISAERCEEAASA
jgi:RNA polymerase sigma factor (sigma-70 family)